MYQVLLFKGNNGLDITDLCQQVRWRSRKGSAARSIIAKLIDDDGAKHQRAGIDVEEGHQAMLLVDGEEVFRGIIMNTGQTQKKVLTFTAYDNGIYLANNKDTFCYERKTASEIFSDVLTRFSIPIGTVSPCSYIIPELTKSKTSAFDTIADALSLDYEATRTRHYILSEKGAISLLTRKENILQWVLEPSTNLISYSRTRSIEQTRTRIKLVSGDGRVLAEASDSALESKIGIFQDIIRQDETLTLAQLTALAKSICAEKAAVSDMLTLNTTGITKVVSGVGVFVKIPHLGASRTYYVDEDTHTFEGEMHTMSLRLNAASDIGTGTGGQTQAQQEDEPAGASFRPGDRVRVREGARTYGGGSTLQSWCYDYEFDVIQVGGGGQPADRVVIGIGSAVTAAMNAADLYRA